MTQRDGGTGAEPVRENGGAHRGETVGEATGAWLREITPKVRLALAKLIWILALLAALTLGLGAVLITLQANPDNVLVATVVGGAEWLDGPFADVFTFADRAQQALVNWGLAAVAYLVAGGILARLVRP